MAAYYDEEDLDGTVESFKDQCEKEDFEDQEERILTDQEWEEEQFLNEQEKNRIATGIDEVLK